MVDLGRPAFGTWVAPASLHSIEVISDLHLAPQTPLTLASWQRYMQQSDADAIFILGDLFEAWVGDDALHSEFEAHCVDVLAQASARAVVAFMVGNRDFLLGSQMLAACRMQALSDPTLLVAFGRRYVLTHGDALCLADTEYQKFRRVVREPSWQAKLLARPLDERRRLAREMRAGSVERQTQQPDGAWVDIDTPMALGWLSEAGSTCLIHGHTHRPGSDAPAPGHVRHVLSDWSFDDAHPARAEILRIDASGVQRYAWT